MKEKHDRASMMLRMPPSAKEWVKRRAQRADRSQNWVVVKLIEQAIQEEEARQ